MGKSKKARNKIILPGELSGSESKIFSSIVNQKSDFEKLDSVEKAKLGNWNHQRTLDEMHEDYLIAKQNGIPSSLDKHVWCITDTFDRWMNESKKMTLLRLEELKEKFEKQIPIFPGMVKHIESGELQNANAGIGRTLSQEDYEFYDKVLRKSLETIDLYFKGQLKVSDNIDKIKELNPDSNIEELEKLAKDRKGKIILLK